MHGSFDQSPQDDQSIYRSWSIKLIAYAVSHPETAKWNRSGAS